MESTAKRATVEYTKYANPPKRKRIAVYVYGDSMGCETQEGYYIEKYNHDDTIDIVGIYSDIRTSKRKTKRHGLLRLIRECKEYGITEVHTKSISRFGRNAADVCAFVKELKTIGVAVVFENESINTSSELGEQLIKMLEAMTPTKIEVGGAE